MFSFRDVRLRRARFALRSLILTLLLAAGIGSLFAQTQAINGSIRGRITDPAGAAIPAATVTITNTATGYTRDVQSSDDGYYVIPNLPLGTYTVTFKKEGFDTERHTDVVLNAGTEAVIDTAMKVGAVSTTVEVTGGAPVIEPSRVSTGRTISFAEVDNVPLTSRNPYNLVIFQPGVSGHPNPELGIPRTLNTNGLLDRINYQMDGMIDTETDRYGLRLFPISDIYVREVQTVSNSFAPEFGQTAGNIFNVISNSGTNTFHGEGYFIGRPPDASARTILLPSNRSAAAIDLHDYAVNAGGPIKKDKVFIFGGYEHLLRGTPTPVTINSTVASQLGLPASDLATAPSLEHVQFLDLRLDWNVNEKNQVFFRYDYFRNEFPFNTQVGGLNALSAAVDFHDRAHIGGLQWLTTFSPTALNELRASEPYRNEAHAAGPLTGPGPEICIAGCNTSGLATFGGTQSAGDRFAEKIPSVSDNFTKIRGAHTYKMGFAWQENNDNQVADTYSFYNFPTVNAYLAAKSGAAPFGYTQFGTVLGSPGVAYKSYFYDFYVQDSWQVRPNLLMIYGVRWDRFQAPGAEPNAPFVYTRSFHTANRDWAPRLGIAWNIRPTTVIRASWGMFYEAPPTNTWFNALYNDGSNRTFVATFTPTQAGAPAFPQVFNFLPGATAPSGQNITAVTPDFKNAYTLNTSFQVEQQISKNDRATLGYVNTGARDLQYLRDMNLINPTGFLPDGRPIFSTAVNAATRLYPQFNGITLQDIGAVSNYNALLVTWWHRLGDGFQISANYTWSHTISDAPDANSFEQNLPIENPYSRAYDRGNSIVNRPQAFNLSTYMAPKFHVGNHVLNYLANGNVLTMLANLASGDQQNITGNLNLNNDPIGAAVQRPAFVGRDTARTGNIYQVDMRYTRTLFSVHERLYTKFIAESNNVFNTRNVTTINTKATVNSQGLITAQPSFAPVSTVLEGRLIQLGIRADF
ncbi:MAG TPA: TonB-dependent receptor [Bryobacteraceae bacterium]|nr:TonB-dependent receptor [Bryobacteraceae bacterium]